MLTSVLAEFDVTFRLASVIAFLSLAALTHWPETRSAAASGETCLSERRLFLAGPAMDDMHHVRMMLE